MQFLTKLRINLDPILENRAIGRTVCELDHIRKPATASVAHECRQLALKRSGAMSAILSLSGVKRTRYALWKFFRL